MNIDIDARHPIVWFHHDKKPYCPVDPDDIVLYEEDDWIDGKRYKIQVGMAASWEMITKFRVIKKAE